MGFVAGQVVKSRRGRDVERLYVVLECDGERLLLVDGAKRSIASPKRKNIRHVAPSSTVLPAQEMKTDREIRAALARIAQQHAPQQGG